MLSGAVGQSLDGATVTEADPSGAVVTVTVTDGVLDDGMLVGSVARPAPSVRGASGALGADGVELDEPLFDEPLSDEDVSGVVGSLDDGTSGAVGSMLPESSSLPEPPLPGPDTDWGARLGDAVPDDAVPDDAVPDDAVPDDAVPDDAVSDEEVSDEEVVSEDGLDEELDGPSEGA